MCNIAVDKFYKILFLISKLIEFYIIIVVDKLCITLYNLLNKQNCKHKTNFCIKMKK